MNKFYKLIDDAEKENIDVEDADLPPKISGLYYNNGTDESLIAINKAIVTQSEKICVIAEELGHHYTSCGNLLTNNEIDNTIIRQQELRAKRWAVKKLVSLKDIIRAYEAGCQSFYDFSVYLDVTEDFLKSSIKEYAGMYGLYKKYKNYVVYFDPPAVLKILE